MSESPAKLEGPAFTPVVKALASVLMLALAIYGWQVLPALLAQRSTWPALLFILLVLAFVVTCYVWMLRSRTSVSETHIRQTWVSDKQIALAEITQIKLIYIPALSWLIAPRLVVRSRTPGSTVFHTADSRVLAAFARLTIGQPPLP